MDDPYIFFREATIRICGSLNIDRAMARCLDYIGGQIPATGMSLHLYEPEFDALRTVAAVMPDRLQRAPAPRGRAGRDARTDPA